MYVASCLLLCTCAVVGMAAAPSLLTVSSPYHSISNPHSSSSSTEVSELSTNVLLLLRDDNSHYCRKSKLHNFCLISGFNCTSTACSYAEGVVPFTRLCINKLEFGGSWYVASYTIPDSYYYLCA